MNPTWHLSTWKSKMLIVRVKHIWEYYVKPMRNETSGVVKLWHRHKLQEQYPDIDRYGLLVAPGHQTAIGVNKVNDFTENQQTGMYQRDDFECCLHFLSLLYIFLTLLVLTRVKSSHWEKPFRLFPLFGIEKSSYPWISLSCHYAVWRLPSSIEWVQSLIIHRCSVPNGEIGQTVGTMYYESGEWHQLLFGEEKSHFPRV